MQAPGPIWHAEDVTHKDLDDAVMHARLLRDLAETSSECPSRRRPEVEQKNQQRNSATRRMQ